MIATENVTLAVLAGGESTRMGRPKAEIAISAKPILEWLLDRFQWDGPTMLVVAPGHEKPSGYGRFASQACDPVSKAGPLRGVLTALENARTPLVAITTVDMPGIERSHFEWLINSITERNDLDVLMPARLSNGKMSCEPFPSVWRGLMREVVEAQIAKTETSVKSMARHARGSMILAPQSWPASVWTNLNTPDDVDSFLRSVGPK